MNRYYGDIPAEHLKLVEELQYLERLVNAHIEDFPSLALGKGFVCSAHDYYSIFMDEEGERLLKLVDQHCPGYFYAPILIHMASDNEFNKLIQGLKKTAALEVMISLGFENESI